jgi:hypothetical protein
LRVIASEKLLAAMRRKGACAIVVDVAFCKSCGGAVGNLFARGVKSAEVARLEAEGGIAHRVVFNEEGVAGEEADGEVIVGEAAGSEEAGGEVVGGEVFELLLLNSSLSLDEEVKLDATPLFGLSDISITGVRY